MPFTPEALAKRAQVAAVYGWFRQRIVLLIVCIMLFLQFMTWRAIDRLYIPSHRIVALARRATCWAQSRYRARSPWTAPRYGSFQSKNARLGKPRTAYACAYRLR